MSKEPAKRKYVFVGKTVEGSIVVPSEIERFISSSQPANVTIEHDEIADSCSDQDATSYLEALDDVHDSYP